MLANLHISKYALIDNFDVDFHAGFSVITGETGAGKSILLGALGLLLGGRADVRSIKTGANKCTVEAVFEVEGDDISSFFADNELDFDGSECILRREIAASGKSRAFINDTPVTLAQIRELGQKLIDIHSQHQNLLLGGTDFQLGVLDCVAGNEALLKKYADAFAKYRKCAAELSSLRETISNKRTDEDYLRYQLEQLDAAALKDGEQEELEQEQEMLSHAEEIKETIFEVCRSIDNDEYSVPDALKRSSASLSRIARYYPEAESLCERLESVGIELKDIADDLSRKLDNDDYNPARLAEVDDRLSLIYDLQRKHKVATIAELLEKAEDIRSQLNLIDDADGVLLEKEKEYAALKAQATETAEKLSQTRRKAAKTLGTEMQKRLAPLGMPDMRFEVQITPAAELSKSGADCVAFLFSANKNAAMRNISDIASGGEIARVMLCLKAITSNVAGCPTIIFDEIDTGVSGRIAEQMALTMEEMSLGNRQVISITHLPQIAARGAYHYHVYKENENGTTNSKIGQLSPDERINEIAYMLSGQNITEAAVTNARELLNNKNTK